MRALTLTVLLATLALTAHAEEGMWPPAHVPLAEIERTFAVKLDPGVLEHIQLSTIRFSGATAFFVSPDGLAITNHHVALRCLQGISTPERNYYEIGFLARSPAAELPCPGHDAKVLISSVDVTARFAGGRGDAQLEAEIENACAKETGLTCEVVSLYGGARRMLYRYKRYVDIRLVAAPEADVAYFGGDPDNFEYPRYGLDVTFLRVYENGKPVTPPGHLTLAARVPVEGDFAMGAGHPFRTSRWLPVSHLEVLRDARLPFWVAAFDRRMKLMLEYQTRSSEAAREASPLLFSARNGWKREAGFLTALQDPAAIRAQQAIYERLAASLTDEEKRRALATLVASADRIAEAQRQTLAEDYFVAHTIGSRLLEWAVLFVRWADETSKPEAARLEDFRGAALRATESWMTSKAPAFPALDTVVIMDRWAEAAQVLGAGHPFVREVASMPIAGALRATSIGSPAVREQLLKRGPQAIRESKDPLLVLARRLEPHLYAVRARYEKEIKEPLARLETELARLRLAAGAGTYTPDANGTLRFAFGRLAGYREGATDHPWATTFRRMYERSDAAQNKGPETLPRAWRDRRDSINLDTRYNFVATVDHAGGNSGSPVMNEKGEWFGVQHDGNRQNFGTQYVYASPQARMVALHADAILEWLRAILGANELVQELYNGRLAHEEQRP